MSRFTMRSGNLPAVLAALLIGAALLAMAVFFLSRRTEPPGIATPPQASVRLDETLGNMLDRVRTEAALYAESRKAADALIEPAQLRERGYVEENYVVMQDLRPLLEARIDTIMALLEEAGRETEAIAASAADPAAAEALRREWTAMEQGTIKPYREYFSLEQRSLGTVSKLLAFYYARIGSFSYDAETGDIIFENPEDAAQEQTFRAALAETRAAQRAVLASMR